jgi:hypothetical protein
MLSWQAKEMYFFIERDSEVRYTQLEPFLSHHYSLLWHFTLRGIAGKRTLV